MSGAGNGLIEPTLQLLKKGKDFYPLLHEKEELQRMDVKQRIDADMGFGQNHFLNKSECVPSRSKMMCSFSVL
jgi:hypothetical protein